MAWVLEPLVDDEGETTEWVLRNGIEADADEVVRWRGRDDFREILECAITLFPEVEHPVVSYHPEFGHGEWWIQDPYDF